jgi:hypothetical protein
LNLVSYCILIEPNNGPTRERKRKRKGKRQNGLIGLKCSPTEPNRREEKKKKTFMPKKYILSLFFVLP